MATFGACLCYLCSLKLAFFVVISAVWNGKQCIDDFMFCEVDMFIIYLKSPFVS